MKPLFVDVNYARNPPLCNKMPLGETFILMEGFCFLLFIPWQDSFMARLIHRD